MDKEMLVFMLVLRCESEQRQHLQNDSVRYERQRKWSERYKYEQVQDVT